MSEEQTSPQTEPITDASIEIPGAEAAESVIDTDAEINLSAAQVEELTGGLKTELEQSKKTIATLEADNSRLSRESSDLKDQLLRTRADVENTRKRLQRDKEEAIQFANKQLLNDVVGIIDDFERAIKSAEASRDFDILHDGISLIERQFITMLESKWGIKRFDAAGEEFDPQKHEAVAAEPRAETPVSSILEVYQKGYMLHDKVLRTAKVKVSLPG